MSVLSAQSARAPCPAPPRRAKSEVPRGHVELGDQLSLRATQRAIQRTVLLTGEQRVDPLNRVTPMRRGGGTGVRMRVQSPAPPLNDASCSG